MELSQLITLMHQVERQHYLNCILTAINVIWGAYLLGIWGELKNQSMRLKRETDKLINGLYVLNDNIMKCPCNKRDKR